MKKQILFGMSLVAIALCSCSNDIELTEDTISQSQHLVTAEQAVDNAATFLNGFSSETRNGETISHEVANVVAYRMSDLPIAQNRSTGDENPVVFYAINYKDNGGYVLAAADNRHQPVYAYVPKGNFNGSQVTNTGFDIFIENLTQSILSGYDYGLLAENNVNENPAKYPPIVAYKLNTAWGMGSPYNQYVQYQNLYLTTMSVALAQIAAYRSSPTTYPSYDTGATATLDWSAIIAESNSHYGYMIGYTAESDSLARFMRSIEDGYLYETAYNSQMCINRVVYWGSYSSNSMVGFTASDISGLKSAISNGHVLYTRGKQSALPNNYYGKGYAWVIDGYNGNYLHCNWGNDGNYNGYFLASGFEPYNGSLLYDSNLAYCTM